MDAVPAPAAAGGAADAADAQLIAGGGQYVWLPRPAAVPEGRTPFAAMDPATAAGQQEGGGATAAAAAAAAAAALPLRLRAPPAVGSRIGGVFFPTTATPELHSSGSVIVVGEWWGIDSHVLQLARHLAAAGFDVLCLDVLRDGPRAIPVDVTRGYETAEGVAAAFAESAHKMKTCDWRSALVDVGAAADWLRSRRRQQRLTQAATAAAGEEAVAAVEERRNGVGILGCSFGAVLALLSAAGHETAGDPAVAAMSSGVAPSPPPVEAAVAFYGLPDERFTGGAVRLWEPAWVQAACQLHFPSAAPGLEGFDDAAKGRELLELLEVVEEGGVAGGVGGAGGGKRHELYEYTVHPCETTPTHIRPLLLALHLFLD